MKVALGVTAVGFAATLAPTPDDDKVFGRIEELEVPLSIHVSLTDTMPAAHRVALPGWGRIFDVPNRMLELIFAGPLPWIADFF